MHIHTCVHVYTKIRRQWNLNWGLQKHYGKTYKTHYISEYQFSSIQLAVKKTPKKPSIDCKSTKLALLPIVEGIIS